MVSISPIACSPSEMPLCTVSLPGTTQKSIVHAICMKLAGFEGPGVNAVFSSACHVHNMASLSI